MMVSTAFVMLMVPGLALFYGGMVRRKNVLATMMQSMVALAVVGVFWFAIGYSLAFWSTAAGGVTFGEKGSILGFSPDLIFLKGIQPRSKAGGYKHSLYSCTCSIKGCSQSSRRLSSVGAIAERIRFKPYCIFLVLWITLVYCPLAHCVWGMDYWTGKEDAGTNAVGLLGKMDALDFAGGNGRTHRSGLVGPCRHFGAAQTPWLPRTSDAPQ